MAAGGGPARRPVPGAVRHALEGGRVLYRAALRFSVNDGAAMSGYLAYTALLALFPFLIFATAIAGRVVGAGGTEAAMAALFEALPAHVVQTLEPAVRQVLEREPPGLVTISALASIWVASNGVEALRTAFERAYEVSRLRAFLLRRLIAALMVLAGVLVFAALGVLIVLAPLILHLVEELSGVSMPAGVDASRYAAGLGLFWGFLWLQHRVLPSRPMGRYRLWPGVLASLVIWMAVATGFSIYLAHAPSYDLTYGTLAGVIVTLLFLYLTGVAMIYGAEVNAVINADLTQRIRAGETQP